MKKSTTLFAVCTITFVLLALWGPLDQKSTQYITSTIENNLKYTELVSGIKLALSGVEKLKIPFIEGEASSISSSLGKVMDNLLLADGITFSQLILSKLSQTILMKALLVILLILSFLPKLRPLSSKFLILALAINPGLSIFTSGVDELSKFSNINFGDSYLEKLEQISENVKNEKAQLIQQHSQEKAQIANGEKHVQFFKKLKEDVSYDVKKVKTEIHGDYEQIRILIHDGAHELIVKSYRLFVMVLFCFLILPFGYVLIIYVIYQHLFKSEKILITDGNELLSELKTEPVKF